MNESTEAASRQTTRMTEAFVQKVSLKLSTRGELDLINKLQS